MDTETVEQGYKATSFPFLPSPPTPPFAECIVTIHTLQSKEAMMTTYGTFFFLKKEKSNNLFLNSVSKFTFA